MRKNWKNPFIASFIVFAAVCCVALSIVYGFIMHMSRTEFQTRKAQERVQLVANDIGSQMDIFETVALKIRIGRVYQPVQFKGIPYNERLLLEDFKQYATYSVLTDECFLYYGSDKLYYSTGYLKFLSTYTIGWEEEERIAFRDQLTEVLSVQTTTVGETTVYRTDHGVYFMIPLRVDTSSGRGTAVLCFVVKESALAERFKVVSGDDAGRFSINHEEKVVFSNIQSADARDIHVTASTPDGWFSVHYETTNNEAGGNVFPFYALLIALDITLIFLAAYLLAERNYKPIQDLRNKYANKTELLGNAQDGNSLTEIGNVLEALLQDNEQIHKQIRLSKALLKKQILKMLIEGTRTKEMHQYMEEIRIRLPGPFFYVATISVEQEETVTDMLLEEIGTELELLSDELENIYIYAISDLNRRCVSLICSIAMEYQRDGIAAEAARILRNYFLDPKVGIGSVKQSISRIPASWLESVDMVYNIRTARAKEDSKTPQYESGNLNKLMAAMDGNDLDAALTYLELYFGQFEDSKGSDLVRKMAAADFVSEMNRYAQKTGIELPSRHISALLTISDFQEIMSVSRDAVMVLHEQLKAMRSDIKEDESLEIYQYIKDHFTEYDMSLELVANNLNVSDKSVRAAVLEHSGMMYKDFLICLRMDYAKTLLETEKITVAEVCQKIGYSNVPYFIKVFKKTTGVTPAQYRSQYGN